MPLPLPVPSLAGRHHTLSDHLLSLPFSVFISEAEGIMSVPVNALALEGGDPRAPAGAIVTDLPVELAMVHNMHDRSVSFEEYVYYANITREEERIAHQHFVAAQGPKTWKSVLKNRFARGTPTEVPVAGIDSPAAGSEKDGSINEKGVNPADGSNGNGGVLQPSSRYITKEEWKRASRAIRTAGWSSVFYLITTDILGPFSVPYVFPLCSQQPYAWSQTYADIHIRPGGHLLRWVTVRVWLFIQCLAFLRAIRDTRSGWHS